MSAKSAVAPPLAAVTSRRALRRRLYALAWPAVLENLLHSLVFMINTALVGRLGAEALGAAGIANHIMFFVITPVYGFAAGLLAIVARAIGRNDLADAQRASRHAFMIGMGFTIVVSVLLMTLAAPILHAAGADAEVVALGSPFLRVASIFTVFQTGIMLLGAVLRGAGDTRTPMVATVVMTIIDGVGGYLLVFDVIGPGGLGLMGVHEWMLKHGHKYEVTDEFKEWLQVWKDESERGANEHCDRLFLSRPKGYRAVAPTGSISMLAGTTSGVEPVFAKAYLRRYIEEGNKWKAQYMVDATAQALTELGINPDKIETAYDLSATLKGLDRRMSVQSEIQQYTDHSISSTINLGSNMDWSIEKLCHLICKHTKERYENHLAYLRGLTFYPDGARGGQPIKEVSWEEALKKRNLIIEDNSEEQCLSGVCGI